MLTVERAGSLSPVAREHPDARGDGKVSAPTPAQLRVLELVALGLSSREIGSRLWVARQTVTYHIGNLLVKLDASTRAGLVARAYALGLLEAGHWPPHASVSAMRGASLPAMPTDDPVRSRIG